MAKDKKKFDIEDPLAGLGFEAEDDEPELLRITDDEVVEEIEEIENEIEDEIEEPKEEKIKQPSPIKEVFAPIGEIIKESASTPVSNQKGGRLIAIVSILAVLAAVAGFLIYTNAPAKSGISVSKWVKMWNEISYTDMEMTSSSDTLQIKGLTLFSNTDHMKLDKSDEKALKNGEIISILDDTCTLQLKEVNGSVEKALFKINWNRFSDAYFADGNYPKTCCNATDDVNLRYALYVGMLSRVGNEYLTNQLHQYATGTTLIDKNYYLSQYGEGLIDVDEDGHAFLTIGDYRYCISVSIDIVTPTDIEKPVSDADVSGSDVQSSIAATAHVTVNVLATYNKIGQKAHPADWTWLTELFEKDEEPSDMPAPTIIESDDDESTSDISSADISATDK